MARVLTERAFSGTPALIGEVVRRHASGETSALAVVEAYVANQGDGSQWTHEQLTRIIDEQAVAPAEESGNVFAPYWAFVGALGRRVGEMHMILAQSSDDPAFAPETVDADNVGAACAGARDQLKAALKALAGPRTGIAAISLPVRIATRGGSRDAGKTPGSRPWIAAHAHPWRSASWTGAGVRQRCLHHRFRRRAFASAQGTPRQAESDARRRWHDPLVRLCRGRYRT